MMLFRVLEAQSSGVESSWSGQCLATGLIQALLSRLIWESYISMQASRGGALLGRQWGQWGVLKVCKSTSFSHTENQHCYIIQCGQYTYTTLSRALRHLTILPHLTATRNPTFHLNSIMFFVISYRQWGEGRERQTYFFLPEKDIITQPLVLLTCKCCSKVRSNLIICVKSVVCHCAYFPCNDPMHIYCILTLNWLPIWLLEQFESSFLITANRDWTNTWILYISKMYFALLLSVS